MTLWNAEIKRTICCSWTIYLMTMYLTSCYSHYLSCLHCFHVGFPSSFCYRAVYYYGIHAVTSPIRSHGSSGQNHSIVELSTTTSCDGYTRIFLQSTWVPQHIYHILYRIVVSCSLGFRIFLFGDRFTRLWCCENKSDPHSCRQLSNSLHASRGGSSQLQGMSLLYHPFDFYTVSPSKQFGLSAAAAAGIITTSRNHMAAHSCTAII